VERPVAGEEDAAAFVATLGLCTWGPVPGLAFPNLAEAMGESALSVLGRTWFWKDDLHFERRLYYGKIIRGQPTFVAPDWLPDCIASLAGPGHEVERDPVRLFMDGRLSREARLIYDYLDAHPALPTRDLRRGAALRGKDLAAATERALADLQRRFLVCKVDLTGRTRGTYSYVWDVAERFWPDAFDQARRTSVMAARARILARLREFGLDPDRPLQHRLLLWR
jgi:hypothetical protein